MGSEYRRQEVRRPSSVPVRHFPGLAKNQQRKSFSSAAGGAPNKIPKTALTPISRLKKFQKLRDRNLRKEVLYRNNIKKHLKMLENAETQASTTGPVKSPQMLKELVKLENGEKEIANGNKENGENGENGLNGIEEELEVVEHNGIEENGEVRRSPRRSRTKEQEVIVKELEVKVDDMIDENEEVRKSPGRRSPEAREIEVDVKIIESPASSSRRRSTPRRATPDVSSTLPDRVRETSFQDSNWMSDSIRISGRRPIRDMSPPRKRKSDDFEEPSSKRMAYTPSIPSPGWRFLSPFSLFKRTPRTISNRPIDDSLFVNVSTDSEAEIDLDTSNVSENPSADIPPDSSEETVERPTTESPSKSLNWLCRLM